MASITRESCYYCGSKTAVCADDCPGWDDAPRRRYRSEVLEARRHAVSGGCCSRFADQTGCDCLENALPDPDEEGAT